MQQKKNEDFEDTLQDILTPNDPNASIPSSPTSKKNIEEKLGSDIHQRDAKKFPQWLDTLIRIFAAIIVIVLLILFGLQISTR